MGTDEKITPGTTSERVVVRHHRPKLIALAWALGAISIAAVGIAFRSRPPLALALAGAVLTGTWLSAIDIREHRLPNRIVGGMAIGVACAVMALGYESGQLSKSFGAIGIGLAASAILLVGNVVAGVGMGDVKYAFPLFALLGWFGAAAIQTSIIVTVFTAGLAGVAVLATGRGRKFAVPYGPFLTLGLVAGLLVAAPG